MDIKKHDGYLITERCTVEDSVFLLGVNPQAEKPFVVWEYTNKAFIHPLYFDNLLQALSDFGSRVKSQADFFIRNSFLNKDKPPRAPDRPSR